MPKKKFISLDALLFLILVILFVEQYQLNILFWILIFILFFFYLTTDFIYLKTKLLSAHDLKCLIIIFLIFFLFTTTVFQRIDQRLSLEKEKAASYPYHIIHDGALQTEEAINFLLQDKNPYRENYFGTRLEKWNQGVIVTAYGQKALSIVNPALYHFIYLPFYLLSSLPFYLISKNFIGWYDQRLVLLIVFILAPFFLYKIPKKQESKRLLLILFAFNPIFTSSFITGFNDIFIFFWLLLSLWLLIKNKITWSILILALACASKQTAWLILPFYFFYLWQKNILSAGTKKGFLLMIKKQLLPFLVVIVLLIGPFLIWDSRSLIDDIFHYPNGSLLTSYPIRGIGFSFLLLETNLIKSSLDYFPFWILQLIIGLPFLWFLLKNQQKNNTVCQMVFNYGIFVFIFLFFSRFFNFNYLTFLSMIFILTYFLKERESLANENKII